MGNPAFGTRLPCCRFSFPRCLSQCCNQSKMRLLESITYEMRFRKSLVLTFIQNGGGVGGTDSIASSLWERQVVAIELWEANYPLTTCCGRDTQKLSTTHRLCTPPPLLTVYAHECLLLQTARTRWPDELASATE